VQGRSLPVLRARVTDRSVHEKTAELPRNAGTETGTRTETGRIAPARSAENLAKAVRKVQRAMKVETEPSETAVRRNPVLPRGKRSLGLSRARTDSTKAVRMGGGTSVRNASAVNRASARNV